MVKKETLAQVFSCEFCEISNNIFSYRTPPVAASRTFNLLAPLVHLEKFILYCIYCINVEVIKFAYCCIYAASEKILHSLCYIYHKGCLRYKTIISPNVSSEAQIKKFFILLKNYIPFSRYSSFCIFNHLMIY